MNADEHGSRDFAAVLIERVAEIEGRDLSVGLSDDDPTIRLDERAECYGGKEINLRHRIANSDPRIYADAGSEAGLTLERIGRQVAKGVREADPRNIRLSDGKGFVCWEEMKLNPAHMVAMVLHGHGPIVAQELGMYWIERMIFTELPEVGGMEVWREFNKHAEAVCRLARLDWEVEFEKVRTAVVAATTAIKALRRS